MWLVIIFVLNMFGARSYGEAEYWFSVVRITQSLSKSSIGPVY